REDVARHELDARFELERLRELGRGARRGPLGHGEVLAAVGALAPRPEDERARRRAAALERLLEADELGGLLERVLRDAHESARADELEVADRGARERVLARGLAQSGGGVFAAPRGERREDDGPRVPEAEEDDLRLVVRAVHVDVDPALRLR